MNSLVFNVIFQGLALWAMFCLAKAVLDFFPLKVNALQNPLNLITSPILKMTAFITPACIPKFLLLFLTVFWLLAARLGFFLLAGAYGVLPAVAT